MKSTPPLMNPVTIRSPREIGIQAILTASMQVADILEALLGHVGPSEIWQSTFSVSEEFLRRLHIFRRQGLITRSSVVLDHKACRKILKLWPFISRVYDNAFMGDNHSKILLIKSQAGDKISVITSQNLTRGNRFESTVIISTPGIFDSLYADLRNLITLHTIPLDELLRTRPQDN